MDRSTRFLLWLVPELGDLSENAIFRHHRPGGRGRLGAEEITGLMVRLGLLALPFALGAVFFLIPDGLLRREDSIGVLASFVEGMALVLLALGTFMYPLWAVIFASRYVTRVSQRPEPGSLMQGRVGSGSLAEEIYLTGLDGRSAALGYLAVIGRRNIRAIPWSCLWFTIFFNVFWATIGRNSAPPMFPGAGALRQWVWLNVILIPPVAALGLHVNIIHTLLSAHGIVRTNAPGPSLIGREFRFSLQEAFMLTMAYGGMTLMFGAALYQSATGGAEWIKWLGAHPMAASAAGAAMFTATTLPVLRHYIRRCARSEGFRMDFSRVIR